jgi:hypothetical protein
LAALQTLAKARHYNVHFGQLGPSLLEAWPAGEARFLQTEMLVAAIGTEAAVSLPDLRPLYRACRQAASNADVREACQRIAGTLLQHNDSLMGVGIGLRLGRSAGLPAADLQAVEAQVNQENQVAVAMDESFSDQPWSCASNALLVEWAQEVQQHGEWGAMQRRLAAQATPRR